MEFFLHPWYMIAGGALVSSPILIHLINRMRFKRIRWAAMEFLLKSQKRNRRRLIIEQLILLLLRILLVLLIAFLMARFIGGALGNTGQGTMHVVVLDDTLSMSDRQGKRTALATAREQIRNLAKMAVQASSAQHMQIFTLSDLDKPVFDDRLGDQSDDKLNQVLAAVKPTALHLAPLGGVEKARNILKSAPQGQKVFHFVGDFRDADWGTGPGVEKLDEQIKGMLDEGINISLLDTASPYRSDNRGLANAGLNLAILDFYAEARMAAEGVPIDFGVTIANYSPQEKKTRLRVKVKGAEEPPDALREEFLASQDIESLLPYQNTTVTFSLPFNKKKATPEFFHIRAEIDDNEDCLKGDNVRDLVVEVRKRIPVLVVDGNGKEGRFPSGDSFHLEIALLAAKAYEPVYKTLDELEGLDLDAFPSIYFLNVPMIKSEVVQNRLREYVQRGGNLAFFLGDKVLTSFYNETLHTKLKGLFPLKIASRATDSLSEEERVARKQKDEQPKILFRDKVHPVVAGLAPSLSTFRYLLIDRYFPPLPRSQWIEENPDEPVKELITLPNRKSIDEYKERAQELGNEAVRLTASLASTYPDFQKYVTPIGRYRRGITEALGTPYLHNLVLVLDKMLKDPGIDKDPDRPKMPDLWAHPGMKSLAAQIAQLADTLLYGDPLLVARPYGKGKVVAFLSSAGTASRWNEWGGGNPVSWSYPVFMMDLQRFLTSRGDELNRIVNIDKVQFTIQKDAAKFQHEVKARFLPQPDLEAAPAAPDAPAGTVREREETWTGKMTLNRDNVLTYTFEEARRPGVYTFEFQPIQPGAPADTYSVAYNVDARAESDLKRTVKEKLEKRTDERNPRSGKVMLLSPGESLEPFKNRDPDASESPWLYLLFLIVLIAEQALAVHLSFHLKGNEAAGPAARRPEPVAA